LCFSLSLWNGKDPILKERLFGLTNSEGNPTHSYIKCLYKYPQAAYPYDQIVKINKERSRTEMVYELSTGVFDDDH